MTTDRAFTSGVDLAIVDDRQGFASIVPSPPRILVVDGEAPIVELVASYLEREGWLVEKVGDGLAALELIRASEPDAVVLALMLPGMNGIDVCRQMRAFWDASILMLTARREEIDRIVGLLRVDGESVETALEFNLLAVLAREPGIVVSRERLPDLVWGIGFIADDQPR